MAIFFLHLAKSLSRRSPSLFVPAYAAATLPSSYADLRASSGLARLLQSDRKAKPSASSSFSDANLCLRRSDTLLTAHRKRDLELSTFAMTLPEHVLAREIAPRPCHVHAIAVGVPEAMHRAPEAHFASKKAENGPKREFMKKL